MMVTLPFCKMHALGMIKVTRAPFLLPPGLSTNMIYRTNILPLTHHSSPQIMLSLGPSLVALTCLLKIFIRSTLPTSEKPLHQVPLFPESPLATLVFKILYIQTHEVQWTHLPTLIHLKNVE